MEYLVKISKKARILELKRRMDNPNITMEEYIRLEEEKARKCRRVFNWETAKYVSSLNNNEIDFRISFNESDNEDYMVVFDKNSFSYKIIYVSDFNTDSENDNEKVNMPSFPSPEPTYTDADIMDFKTRLAKIYKRE
nr:hypothetical protein [Tanacetum cinerariifolium]